MRRLLVQLILLLVAFSQTFGCAEIQHAPAHPTTRPALEQPDLDEARRLMVASQIADRGVRDPRVLEAMRKVPRHLFVPAGFRAKAYQDSALPIGHGQTISQPYMVATMTEAARILSTDRVLEIGTGSGYQAAVLACVSLEVYTIEILEPLGRKAKSLLESLKYENIRFRIGDGYHGWPEQAPFDAIIVTAAPIHIPQPLVDQLRVGGRLILPLGGKGQRLVRMTKTSKGLKREILLPVRFVPMVGKAQEGKNGRKP